MTDMTPAPLGADDALAVREQAAQQRAALTRRMLDLRTAQADAKAEIAAKRAELEAELARRTADLAAQMGPLEEQLAQMQEILLTVNLYLGREETLQLIRDGDPAPAGTPITIRQKVLVMAEESLVLMDEAGSTGMNYHDIELFVDWLTAAPENLDRILPEPKGLVVLIPTRVESRSGNQWEDAAKNAANQESYWLLRNGERLYLLTVDPSLRVRDRVLPRRTEFTDVFDQRLFGFARPAGAPLEPGSEEWLALEKKADARRRHFMRIMLVLQGIIDRTPVWVPLPEGGVNLLSVEAQETGKVVLVQDGDPSIALTDRQETFSAYQKRLNGLLRPGLRVIGDWASQGFRDCARDYNDRWTGRNSRLSPATASEPVRDTPYLLEDRRRGGFVFRYERTDQVYKRDVPVPDRPGYVYRGAMPVAPARRASCLVLPEDDWVLPYDLVTVPELERFLASREERSKHFLSMVPTIKAALTAKRAEAEQEAPFRDLLAAQFVGEGADLRDAPGLVDELVHWWKVANAWSRPLNGAPKDEAKASREILAEYKARQDGAARQDETDQMVALGRSVPGAVCVAVNRSGKWFAYAPAAAGESVFLNVTSLRRDGTLGATREWVAVPQRSVSRLQVAWSTDVWDGWSFTANPRHYLTGPEREALVEQVRATADGLVLAVVEFHDPADPGVRGLASYSWTGQATPEDTPVRVARDPLSWHHERDGSRLVTMRAYRVVKDTDGARLESPPESDYHWAGRRFSRTFDGYAGDDRWGAVPWSSSSKPGRRAAPGLVWADENALDRVNAWVGRCADEARRVRVESRERDVLVYRYVRRVQGLIMSRLEGDARERFTEDYGAGADDLWESHLKSLGLSSPIHDRTLWGLFTIRVLAGLPVAGVSLGELARYAYEEARNDAQGEWHPEYGVQNMHGWDTLVVPEVTDEDEPGV